MNHMLGVAIATMLALVSFAETALAQAPRERSVFCRSTGWHFFNLPGVHTLKPTMRVANNGRCIVNFTTNGADPARVTVQARVGQVHMTGGYSFVYMPKRGYTGPDMFVVSYVSPAVRARVDLEYSVMVLPAREQNQGASTVRLNN